MLPLNPRWDRDEKKAPLVCLNGMAGDGDGEHGMAVHEVEVARIYPSERRRPAAANPYKLRSPPPPSISSPRLVTHPRSEAPPFVPITSLAVRTKARLRPQSAGVVVSTRLLEDILGKPVSHSSYASKHRSLATPPAPPSLPPPSCPLHPPKQATASHHSPLPPPLPSFSSPHPSPLPP